jgi:hypothetical protein
MKLFPLLFENVLEEDNLEEMPIQQFKTVGDWSKRSSFRHDVDRRLLTTPKAVEKIHRQWEKTPYDFDLFLVNSPKVNKLDFREQGEVDLDFIRDEVKLTPEEFPDPNPNAITIIFTGNFGDERNMASGWILAHRVGHAFARGNGSTQRMWEVYTNRLERIFVDILRDVYGIQVRINTRPFIKADVLKLAAQQIGTMKSARDNNLRTWYEFAYELFAQYLLTGKIKLKALEPVLVTKIKNWGHKDTRVSDEGFREDYNSNLRYFEEELENLIDNVLGTAIGSIFLM